MAGTKNTSHVVQLKPVEIPKCMQEGEKFIKWDEDSGVGTPVTLRVDKHGFYVYWIDQNKEMDMLDIATIRDTRTGRYAKIPKDSRLRQVVTMGSQDTLEEKTVTLCYGPDFVNLSYINFCCTKKEIAQLWTDELLKVAYSLMQINSSSIMFLHKAHTKLTLMTDKSGKVPVKNIVKLFTTSKDDRKRVEKAMDISGLPAGKNDALSVQKFQFEDFFNFYKNLTQRTEVEKIFDEICAGTSKRKLMTAAQFVEFLNKTQRDPRLNEILYPYVNAARAKDLIQQYEPNKYNAQKGQLSFDGFLLYLMSEDNPIVSPSRFDLSDDMDQPLPHYFINSSHNTYLIGHQLTGKSSVEMYRQCLLAGCRCVELDFWNGRTEEPVIVHGYTFVPEISAKEVIEAIAEAAFKTSDYPVILSFENHCNPRQQAKIAQYCREIFGENLLDAPLESHKLEPGSLLPPPSFLKRKIIIKNKKKHHHAKTVTSQSNSQSSLQQDGGGEAVQGNGDIPHHHPPLQTRQGSKESAHEEDENDEDDESSSAGEGEDDGRLQEKPSADKVAAAKETEAGAEISALVNYVQPVHFSSFENSEKKNRCYEMSSFDEKQATTLLKERPIEFVNYNKHQLSRVYPTGTRFDSSNFMPQVFWNAGCQLVALNYQTLDIPMQLNLGLFEYNHRCGYLLKPEFMRRKDRRLDPFAESTVDGIVAGTVQITVISGQFLTDKRVGTYVEVDMYGLPADTVRKKFRTKTAAANGINPVYEEEPFVFKKVVLPELASLRLAAYEENGHFIGHRVLPVVGLCPGYRHVALRTESGQPLPLATLFLYVVVKDYVPDGLSELAEALANPIKYQSELEKREQQLAVLMDVIEETPSKTDIAPTHSSPPRKPSTNELPAPQPPIGPERPETKVTEPSSTIIASDDPESGIKDQGSNGGQQSIPPAFKTTAPIGIPTLSEDIVAEPLEKLMEYKVVKQKRLELEKKLDSLKKKHEKEKSRVHDGVDGKIKYKFVRKNLVKRLSSKNIDLGVTSVTPQQVDTSVCSDCDSDASKPGSLPRSHSERLLAICKEHLSQERELEERYSSMIFATVEKLMRTSQSNQLKMLTVLLERETNDVMRKLEATRREEVKNLSKAHSKEGMDRIRRELASAMIEKGVHERERLTKKYDQMREGLKRQHEEVQNAYEEERKRAMAESARKYEDHMVKLEEELQQAAAAAAAVTAAASSGTEHVAQ